MKQLKRFSFNQLIRGTVYYNGKKVHSFVDLGYNNIASVISELAKFLPPDIPKGCWAKFKIENLDKEEVGEYDRIKGKGFF